MGLFDKLKGVLGSKHAEDTTTGKSDSSRAATKSKVAVSSKRSTAAARTRCNIEARFERLRSSVTGTMGNFYVARDRVRKEIVGVKICDPEKVAIFEARFKGLKKPSEGEIAMRMVHPRVMETYEHGETTRGERYLVVEYVPGPNLQHVVQNADHQQLIGKRLNLIRQMAEAIAYVHSMEFIHRDICPRNFICLPDLEGLKLIDFGLTVPATPPFMQPGNRTGTPLYMSPEVVRRKATDKRLDIFSFGVTCYCLTTFQFPWEVIDTSGKAALQHDTHPPRDIFELRPELHPVLGRAIMTCLQPQADRRTPAAKVFLKQIEKLDSELA